jgi:hypothetical protein
MRCLECGAEMRLVSAVRDETMMVPGYEDQTLECTGCRQVERRRVFRPPGEALSGETTAPQPAAETIDPVASEPVAPDAATARDAASDAHVHAHVSESVPTQPSESSAAAAMTDAAEPVPLAAGEPPAPDAAELDEDHELLRRAIAMVKSPIRSGQRLQGLTDGLRTPAALAAGMRARKATRVVQIRHDPSYDAAYAAKDMQTGLVVLRHQDSARLRQMCERLGWDVLDEGAAAARE